MACHRRGVSIRSGVSAAGPAGPARPDHHIASLRACLGTRTFWPGKGEMLAKVMSCAIVGLDAKLVEVEVDIIRGGPIFNLVGLPDAAVRESRDRVHSAIKNSGFSFPSGNRITVNLAPADLRKEGPAYDLPIAVGILAASQQVWPDRLAHSLFIGELSLDGTTRHTKGILPMTALARAEGYERVFVPAVDAGEAALLLDVEVIPATSLSELVGHLTGMRPIAPHHVDLEAAFQQEPAYAADFADIMGQEHVKRAMEVAAAGGHNVPTFGTSSRCLHARGWSGFEANGPGGIAIRGKIDKQTRKCPSAAITAGGTTNRDADGWQP